MFDLVFFFVFFTYLQSSSNMLIAMWFFKIQVRVTTAMYTHMCVYVYIHKIYIGKVHDIFH